MARSIERLNALQVAKLKKPGYYCDGGGLYLQVSASGSKSWLFRFKLHKRPREMGMGAVHTISLAEARGLARQARQLLLEGIDPIERRNASKNVLMATAASARTFAQCLTGFLEAREGEWRNAKHRQQWENSLTTHAFPVIGKLLVSNISLSHVLAVLEPIWSTKTETAQRVRGRIEQVLDWASVRGLRSGDNPARWRGHLDKVLSKPSKVKKVVHHPAVAVEDVADFMVELRKRDGVASCALEFLVYTAARSGEVRGAVWSEFDLEAGVWTIPANRMKAKREHRVPLPESAIRILKEQSHSDDCDYVFPGTKNQPLSDMSLSAVMRRMGVKAVPHGFRSTFRDWAAERTNYPRELAEQALAHTLESKVEAAYQRSDMLTKRRHMMEAWDKFCNLTQFSGDVVTINSKVAA